MFGFNSEQVYKDEIGALNNRRNDIEFDLGDRARQIYGSLIGKDYSKEGLLKGAAEAANRKLTDAYGGRAAAVKANLGPLNSTYQGVEGKTTQEIEAQLTLDEGKAKALQTVMANNPKFDPTTLSPTATAGAIYGAGAKAAEKAKKAAVTDERDYQKKLVDAANERSDRLLREANLRADTKEKLALLREERKDARDRLDRLETQKMNMQLRGDEMKFKYAQLAQQDRNARQDKKDRAMMALIQGLGNLGAAFTI